MSTDDATLIAEATANDQPPTLWWGGFFMVMVALGLLFSMLPALFTASPAHTVQMLVERINRGDAQGAGRLVAPLQGQREQLVEILQRGSALPVPLQAGRLVDYEMTLDRTATQAAAGTIRIYKLTLEGDDGSTLQTTLRFWQASSFGSPGWWMRFPSITDLGPLPAPERPARRR